ncbi:MAG: hypothetical protein EA426_16485 [Spirochaetaceae bacterium]|nr:MAG: hypothetical protein EA426_16485 [Spirochaetaceae bacterium]
MRRHFRIVASIAAALMVAVGGFFVSCTAGSAARAYDADEMREIAQLVSHVPGGVVPHTQPILIRFGTDVVESSQVGSPADRAVVFAPRVRGNAVWQDTRTLRFTPDSTFPMRAEVTATIDLARVFGATLPDSASKEYVFSFATDGPEILAVNGAWEPAADDDPDTFAYSGIIAFSAPRAQARVERAVSFTLNGTPVRASFEASPDGTEYTFATAPIERIGRERSLSFFVDPAVLELSSGLTRTAPLEPRGTFAVRSIEARNGAGVSFALEFSDELAVNQDLTGLIRVEPHRNVRIQPVGRTAYIHGEFANGDSYDVVVEPGVRSTRGGATGILVRETTTVPDVKPRIEYLSDGVFLPSSGDGRLQFRTVNVRAVHVTVTQVFENNLGQFLQTEQLSSSRSRRSGFNQYFIERVGVPVATEVLTIGERRNEWLVNELDLRRILDDHDKGLYLVELRFERDDMLYDLTGGPRWFSGDDYFNDPRSPGYLHANGRATKAVMLSDVGLTWKKQGERHAVFTTNLLTGRPLSGVEVTLRTFQNQVAGSAVTDVNGFAEIATPGVPDPFYATAEKNGQRSVIKANEMAWNLSSFDVAGADDPGQGTRAFIFTERGVYRPGDTINLSAILRNADDSFPARHPVSIKVTNSRGQLHLERTTTDGTDGFYTFTIPTRESDPTGTWHAELTAGTRRFTEAIRIETVVPNRLRVGVTTDRDVIRPDDRRITVSVESSYLFGAPSANLDLEVNIDTAAREKTFARFPGFSFTSESHSFPQASEQAHRGTLDASGRAEFVWSLPSFEGVPSAADLRIRARVLEPGGRANFGSVTVPVDPYSHYAGIAKPDLGYGFAQIGAELTVPVLSVRTDGTAVAGRRMTYNVYRNDRYWWWEYETYSDFRSRYRSDGNTTRVATGTVTSGTAARNVTFVPDGWGEYLFEVVDASGHRASFFFRASSWADSAVGPDDGILTVTTDRTEYAPGDTARVTVVTPADGTLLATLERGAAVLSHRRVTVNRRETILEFAITEDLAPTAYVSVSLFQPHAQTENDRPIRMYGVVPINVYSAASRQGLNVDLPDVIEPEADFTVSVRTADERPTQFVVAVVDEGLLDLTGFRTPNPWENFYRKQRLAVATYDLFNQVIGAHRGDIFRVFSIGGGAMGELGLEERGADGERRFEPVSLFAGPITTDSSGRGSATFTMPNYLGSVRVMVISAVGARYGRFERAVPVKSEIVTLPTVPRVLGPAEHATLPVSLFALADGIGTITVELAAEGPITIVGSRNRTIRLGENEEGEVRFEIETDAAVGRGALTFTTYAPGFLATLRVPIEIRASAPPALAVFDATVEPGARTSFGVPIDGIAGTNTAALTIAIRGNLDLGHRMNWLIRYPYGCIEQTVSAVLPQLYLPAIGIVPDSADLDGNIRAAIESLRRFQLPSGAFAYWPGQRNASIWGTNYAGHFLIEAKARGYEVPSSMMNEWLRFQRSAAIAAEGTVIERVYRTYLLALAGEPAIGAMNLLRENTLARMRDVERWLLGAAYSLAGIETTANAVLGVAGTKVEEYAEFGGSYGSTVRDYAMILDAAVVTGNDSVADSVFELVAEAISDSETWYSTQTLGYGLLATGKYLDSISAGNGNTVAGFIELPDGSRTRFESEEIVTRIELTDEVFPGGVVPDFPPFVGVEIDRGLSARRVFVSLEWTGRPLVGVEPASSRNLSLDVRFADIDGRTIDPTRLTQGTEFWAHYRVRKTRAETQDLAELAVTQIIPSGWEIVNIRLTGEEYPNWMRGYELSREDHTEIRDDRVSWFFAFPRTATVRDFAVKLQAVYEGDFELPPAVAEAMYRSDYRSVVPGGRVRVVGRDR